MVYMIRYTYDDTLGTSASRHLYWREECCIEPTMHAYLMPHYWPQSLGNLHDLRADRRQVVFGHPHLRAS